MPEKPPSTNTSQLMTFIAAAACVLVCAGLSFMWVRAEAQLGDARVQLERALRHRVELELQKGKAGQSANGDAALRDEVQKLGAEIKRMKAKMAKAARRPYGPEQVTGEPDASAGDSTNAWCPAISDGQMEWLLLEYEAPGTIAAVKVYENYNRGALSAVSVVDAAGKETVAWKGADPMQPGATVVTLTGAPTGNRIKIYLDSVKAPGWNEIDAVGIIEPSGKVHWAINAEASSTYGDPQQPAGPGRRNEAPLEF